MGSAKAGGPLLPKMDAVPHVSRPLQIALLVVLVVGAAWLLVLRPKGSGAGAPAASTPAATTPATTTGSAGHALGGLGRAIDKARATKAAGDQQATQASNESATSGGTSAAAGSTAAGPSAGSSGGSTIGSSASSSATAGSTSSSNASAGATSSSTPSRSGLGASSLAGLSHVGGASSPAAVASALAHHRVVALLFWNPAAADDRYVRAALKQVHFSRRRVLIAAAPIARIAQYTPVTGSLSITESPTIVVVDPTGRAHLLVGYVDPAEIARAIQRALLGNSSA